MNIDNLPALDLEAGLPGMSSEDPVTSIGDVMIGIVTGIVAGVTN